MMPENKCVKVSVIMPVYNNEEFLAQAIDSILCQTMRDFELIIISEYGSSKKSNEILKAYGKRDSRIRIFYNESLLGISASLNTAIELAQGEYIARMDADDISLPERLKIQSDLLDTRHDIGICGCETEFIDENENPIENYDKFSIEPEQIKSDLLFFCCVRHPTTMMRKSALNEFNLRYNESFSATEDFELWSRACRFLSFYNIPQTLLSYRWYQNNATHSRSGEGIDNYIKVMDSSFNHMGLFFTHQELEMLCPLTCRINHNNHQEVRAAMEKCQNEIISANEKIKIYDCDSLKNTCDRRFYWNRHHIRMYIVIFIRFISDIFKHKSIAKKFDSLANYLEMYGPAATLTRIFTQILVCVFLRWNIVLKMFKRVGVGSKREIVKLILQFIKFAVVGVSNAIISLVVYYVFVLFSKDLYMIGNVASWIAGVANSFYWNSKFIFGSNENIFKALLKTYLAYGGTLILSMVLIYIEVNYWGISEFLAPIINILITTPINFVMNKFWAFKSK